MSRPDDLMVHMPLPYVVRLRVAHSDDAKPETVTERVVAYSILDAMMQASLRVRGMSGLAEGQAVVEDITPDTEAWLAMARGRDR